MKRVWFGALLIACVLWSGCSDDESTNDVQPEPDASPSMDAEGDGQDDPQDAQTEDVPEVPPDADEPRVESPFEQGIDPTVDGPFAASFSLRTVQVGERALPVGVWGPTSADAQAVGLDALVVPDRAEAMRSLLEQAPQDCPTRSLEVAVDGALEAGQWPLVVYSHCHECLGVSGATVARRLATWGHVVLVPDHVGNTLWDAQDGTGVPLGAEFLEVRGNDVSGLIDAVEAGSEPLQDVSAQVNLLRVGVVGHSFGAVTAGWVAERDGRVDAAMAIAAPIENLLLPGVTAANVTIPTVMMVAVEDNSIFEIGNRFLRENYEALGGPAVKVEVADAGHWSVSDVCGLVEAFVAGCGEGERQTDGMPFEYMEPVVGRAVTASWAVALFGGQLHSDASAQQWLLEAPDDDVMQVLRRQWP